MRPRLLVLFAVVLLLQAAGCGRLCRCCGNGDSRLPPQEAQKDERPPLLPNVSNSPASELKPTGAYGGN